MIVRNIGYTSKERLLERFAENERFAIFETSRGTLVLVLRPETSGDTDILWFPQKDRLPHKITEGKRVLDLVKRVLDNDSDPNIIDTADWNNGSQLVTYESFTVDY